MSERFTLEPVEWAAWMPPVDRRDRDAAPARGVGGKPAA